MITKHYLLDVFERNKPLAPFDSTGISLLMRSAFRMSDKTVQNLTWNLMWITFSRSKLISPMGHECSFCTKNSFHQSVQMVLLRRTSSWYLISEMQGKRRPSPLSCSCKTQISPFFCTIIYKFRTYKCTFFNMHYPKAHVLCLFSSFARFWTTVCKKQLVDLYYSFVEAPFCSWLFMFWARNKQSNSAQWHYSWKHSHIIIHSNELEVLMLQLASKTQSDVMITSEYLTHLTLLRWCTYLLYVLFTLTYFFWYWIWRAMFSTRGHKLKNNSKSVT